MSNLTKVEASKPSALDVFSAEVGREAIVGMLETAEAGTKFAQLHAAIIAVKNRKTTLAQLCRNCNIRWDEMVDFHRNFNVQQGLLRASNHLPHVMEDVAVDAKSRVQGCTRCDGAGKMGAQVSNDGEVLAEPKDCPDCEGTGKVRVPGDQGARNLMFETMGLTGKSKGPLVAQQFLIAGAGVEPIGNVVGAVQKLIGGGR